MVKKLLTIGIVVFFIATLFVMYGTNVGIPGITQYWTDFELLDMMFSYTSDNVTTVITNLGVDGVGNYLIYYAVDFCFIAGLFGVQFLLSRFVTKKAPILRKCLISFAIGRGVFDMLENIMLALILSGTFSIELTAVASKLTSIKFAFLYFWEACFAVSILYGLAVWIRSKVVKNKESQVSES